MIVISDTNPLISLIKINHLELIGDLFGEIQIPDAVYRELVSNKKYTAEADLLLMDEVKGRQVARNMGINLMGTIGILMQAYDSRLLSKEEIEECIEILRSNGRHISDRLYEQLIERIKE